MDGGATWLGPIVALTGVTLGFALARWGADTDRKRQIRALLEAVRWELIDAKEILAGPAPLMVTQIPSVERSIAAGLLMDVPVDLREGLLSVRSLMMLHNHSAEGLVANLRAGLAGPREKRVHDLADHTERAHSYVPYLEKALHAIEAYATRTDFHSAERRYRRLVGKPTSQLTQRGQ